MTPREIEAEQLIRQSIKREERERCAAELEKAFAECDTLNLLHGAARIRALAD